MNTAPRQQRGECQGECARFVSHQPNDFGDPAGEVLQRVLGVAGDDVLVAAVGFRVRLLQQHAPDLTAVGVVAEQRLAKGSTTRTQIRMCASQGVKESMD